MQAPTGKPTMSHLHSTKDPLYHLTWKILDWMLGMTIILSCWTLSPEMLQHSSQNGADTTTFAPSRASMPQMMPIPAAMMTSLLICLGNQRLLMTQYYGMILWMMHSGRRWTTSYHVLRIESSSTLRNSNLPVTSLILVDSPSPKWNATIQLHYWCYPQLSRTNWHHWHSLMVRSRQSICICILHDIVLWVQMPIKLINRWMLDQTDNTCTVVLLI